jgi:hypothetical protein
VPRSPSVVVPVSEAAASWPEFDSGLGAVLAGDSRNGYHGGASLVRWVVDDATASAAIGLMESKCDRVRIMPFLEGVACSVHGVVLDDGVAAFRPVEMVTLRRGHELMYTGGATFWDPDPDVRDAMRDAARRLGEVLRREVGFRGAFTLDGVDDGEQFWPTELNPRFGVGLTMMMRGHGDLPLSLVLDLVVAGRLNVEAEQFEEYIVPVADAHRYGGSWHGLDGAVDEFAERPLSFDGSAWSWAADGDDPDGVVVSGGTFVRLLFDPDRTPVGASVGARAVAFYEFCDRELGTSFGRLTACLVDD